MSMNSWRKFFRADCAPQFDALHRFAPARAMMARGAPPLLTAAGNVQYKFIQVGLPVIAGTMNTYRAFPAHAVDCYIRG